MFGQRGLKFLCESYFNQNQMKNLIITIIALTVLGFSGLTGFGQSPYILNTGYTVTINGSSNVHDWSETVNKVTGDAQIVWNTDGSFTIKQLSIKMDVASIESEHGSIMDNKTFDALKGKSYPYITFKMTELKSIVKSGTGYQVKMLGDLTIAGKTNHVELSGMAYVKENGKLLFDGSKALKMTSYGIDPPTAMMGAMKVSDDITIKFKVYYNMK